MNNPLYTPIETVRLMNYRNVLSSIARERGFEQLAAHIDSFMPSVVQSNIVPGTATVYNITKAPEATCDGCQ